MKKIARNERAVLEARIAELAAANDQLRKQSFCPACGSDNSKSKKNIIEPVPFVPKWAQNLRINEKCKSCKNLSRFWSNDDCMFCKYCNNSFTNSGDLYMPRIARAEWKRVSLEEQLKAAREALENTITSYHALEQKSMDMIIKQSENNKKIIDDLKGKLERSIPIENRILTSEYSARSEPPFHVVNTPVIDKDGCPVVEVHVSCIFKDVRVVNASELVLFKKDVVKI